MIVVGNGYDCQLRKMGPESNKVDVDQIFQYFSSKLNIFQLMQDILRLSDNICVNLYE